MIQWLNSERTRGNIDNQEDVVDFCKSKNLLPYYDDMYSAYICYERISPKFVCVLYEKPDEVI